MALDRMGVPRRRDRDVAGADADSGLSIVGDGDVGDDVVGDGRDIVSESIDRLRERAEQVKIRSKMKKDINDEELRIVAIEYGIKAKTAKEIAEERGLSYGKVLRLLRDSGVQVVAGRRGRKYEGVRKLVQKDLLEGFMDLQEISVKHGVSLAIVEKIARRLAEFRKTYKDSKWGRNEVLVEEVLHRIREEWGAVEQPGGKDYQLKIPGL